MTTIFTLSGKEEEEKGGERREKREKEREERRREKDIHSITQVDFQGANEVQ